MRKPYPLWLRKVSRLIDAPRYDYYHGSTSPQTVKHKLQAAQLSQEILNPSLRNPQFLVLRERSRIFSLWIENLPNTGLQVLDVGGRLQPYRSLLGERLKCYIAIDPVFEGLLNVVAVGEHLPFPSERFDLVICTQVLNYTANPFQVIAEIHRVLRPDGALFLSVPVWRLMPEELVVLLSPFSFHQIVPEGDSVAGLCSVLNLFLDTFLFDALLRGWRTRRLISFVVFPVTNLAGLTLDTVCRNSRFPTNYSCRALK
jgi:SAM-dependent methyltransferase